MSESDAPPIPPADDAGEIEPLLGLQPSVAPAPETGAPVEDAAEVSTLPPSRFAPRFHFFYGMMLALVIAAAVVVVAVANQPAPAPGLPWSSWRPADTSAAGAQQIADHVAPEYRLPNGRQLVTVRGGPLQFQKLDASIVIKSSGATTQDALVGGSSVLFVLSGDASNGSISYGKPSTQRALLLEREVLEMALYAFRYVDNIENVVAIMPPLPGARQTSATAILLQRQDVAPVLGRPLDDTLAARTPSLTNLSVQAAPDLQTVRVITGARLFRYALQQTQDLRVQLELTPATG